MPENNSDQMIKFAAQGKPAKFGDQFGDLMKDKVNDYEIESGTYSTYWSSSKASIGDYASKMLKKIYQEQNH